MADDIIRQNLGLATITWQDAADKLKRWPRHPYSIIDEYPV